LIGFARYLRIRGADRPKVMHALYGHRLFPANFHTSCEEAAFKGNIYCIYLLQIRGKAT